MGDFDEILCVSVNEDGLKVLSRAIIYSLLFLHDKSPTFSHGKKRERDS